MGKEVVIFSLEYLHNNWPDLTLYGAERMISMGQWFHKFGLRCPLVVKIGTKMLKKYFSDILAL